ncbi:MAG: RdgB/HAM1 family non-canonical purine NTP pyrophosphatase [Bacillota bacterium]
MKAIAATNNRHKLEEISAIMSKLNIEVLSLKDIDLDIDVEETGDTFEENALLKARAVAEITKGFVIADDSGLEVEALGNRPGVSSARYSGYTGEVKDAKNREKLLFEMQNIPFDKRNARFRTVIAAVLPDGREILAEGFVYGRIGFEEKGTNGFGYDSLFIVDSYGKTMAELPAEIKNSISHRANALKEFVTKYKEMMGK